MSPGFNSIDPTEGTETFLLVCLIIMSIIASTASTRQRVLKLARVAKMGGYVKASTASTRQRVLKRAAAIGETLTIINRFNSIDPTEGTETADRQHATKRQDALQQHRPDRGY